jgi:hypothetical protein
VYLSGVLDIRPPEDSGSARNVELLHGRPVSKAQMFGLDQNGNLGLVIIEPFRNDCGVGPTQVAVVHGKGREAIYSANHGTGQVVRYELSR